MLDSQFYNKKGELTKYALACGYIQKFYDNNQTVTLWMEHNTLHVRHFNHKTIEWYLDKCFDTLTDARKAYNLAVKIASK